MAYSRGTPAERAAAMEMAAKKRQEDKTSNAPMGAIAEDGVPKTALDDVPKDGSQGRPKLIRILGRPAASRKDPTDVKEIFVSDIAYLEKVPDPDSMPTDPATARRRTMRCIWPKPDPDQPSLLWRMHDKVMEYRWDKDMNNGKGGRVYYHAEGDARVLFNEVAFCGKPGQKVDNPWQPKRSYLMNVIDRSLADWHRANKSTALLCSKRNAWVPKGKSEEQVRWSLGVGTTAYNAQIYDQVVDAYGYWDDYDILIWKLSDTPWYMAKKFDIEPEKTAKLGLSMTPEMLKVGGSPLSDEEMSYDLIDFDASYPVTSYRQIRAKLGYVFMLCDDKLGTHFYEELEALAEHEIDESIDEDPADETTSTAAAGWTASSKPAEASVASKPAEAGPTLDPKPAGSRPEAREEARAVRREEADIDWDGLADGSLNGKQYLGVPLLSNEERSMILGVKEDGSFDYVKDWPVGSGKKLKVLKNTSNGFYSPYNFKHCPLSGAEFKD